MSLRFFKKIKDRVLMYECYEYEFVCRKFAEHPGHWRDYLWERNYLKALLRHYFWKWTYRTVNFPFFLLQRLYDFYWKIYGIYLRRKLRSGKYPEGVIYF